MKQLKYWILYLYDWPLIGIGGFKIEVSHLKTLVNLSFISDYQV